MKGGVELIKSLTVVLGHGKVKKYKVGKNGVTSIKDYSLEYDDAIEFCYTVYSNKKPIVDVENCPVIIEYQ